MPQKEADSEGAHPGSNGQYKLDPSGVIEQWGTLELAYASANVCSATWTFPTAFSVSGYGSVFLFITENDTAASSGQKVAKSVPVRFDHTADDTATIAVRANSNGAFVAADKITVDVYARGT